MAVAGIVAVLALMALGSFVFSTLTYSLRDLTRPRLADHLERHGKSRWLEKTLDRVEDLTLVTAVLRMVANTLLVLASFALAARMSNNSRAVYAIAAVIACAVTFFCSVAFPHALAAHASAEIVGLFIRPLHALRFGLSPVMGLMRGIDNVVRNATGVEESREANEIQQEILSVVEEGEKEGVVDEQEREMIESVIEFRDTTAGQIMTPRPRVIAIEQNATLAEIKQVIQDSSHSRLPIYNGTLDQVVGIVYARDLLRHLGEPAQKFDVKSAMRPAFYVPETKPLRDLLRDFRLQKIHLAIVIDEYGGTAGLVTIEDVLEELVGGNNSEEPAGAQPAMFKRLSDNVAEADARLPIAEVNRLTGLSLPEDAGYDTLGGFVSTTIGRIPEAGFSIEYNGTRFTVLDAEPQKINRLRIEQAPQGVPEPATVEAQS
jgi:CBS domain containing-hemolysin-like protein